MEPFLVYAIVALALGVLIGWLVTRSRAASALQRAEAERDLALRERSRLEGELSRLREAFAAAQEAKTRAETRLADTQQGLADMSSFVDSVRPLLEETFVRHSNAAAQRAIEQLLQVVKPHLDGNSQNIVSTLDTKKVEIEGLLAPVREMLDRYQAEVRASEQKRTEGYAGLQEQIRHLLEAARATQAEASRLYGALKAPTVRGTWGENTLRNCVEMAGMSEFCDFGVQMTFENEDKRRLRPDMIVHLPDDRVIAVDSKAPYSSYIEAAEAEDEKTRRDLLAAHAASLRRHITELSRKEYQDNIQKQLGKSLDFTILFIGGEAFLSSAMIADPGIFEFATEKNIVLASPTILVPLLKALASGWKAERMEENALHALKLGQGLYEQFVRVFDQIAAIGKALNSAVTRYNTAIGAIDALVPRARQLGDHVSSKPLPEVPAIEEPVRESVKMQAQSLLPLPGVGPRDDAGEEKSVSEEIPFPDAPAVK